MTSVSETNTMRTKTIQSNVLVLAGVYGANTYERVALRVAKSNFEPSKLERGGVP